MNGPDMRRRGGFSIIELVVAPSVLAIVAMGLCAMLASSQRLTNLSRERAIAMNAQRAYVEAMRGKTTFADILNDTTTPASYLPSASALKSATGEVCKVDYEDGGHAVLMTGTFGSTNTTSSPVFTDGARLGFPRDITGDGLATANPVTNMTRWWSSRKRTASSPCRPAAPKSSAHEGVRRWASRKRRTSAGTSTARLDQPAGHAGSPLRSVPRTSVSDEIRSIRETGVRRLSPVRR